MGAPQPLARKTSGRWFSPAEDAVLRRWWTTGPAGPARVQRELPHRARTALYGRARALGLANRRRWTPADDAYLRREWHVVAPATLRQHLPGRTWVAIHERATKALGLPGGVPQGHESLRTAVARTGFDHKQLARVLGWAGVPVGRVYGRGRGWCVVDPDLVDDAVRRWLATETVAAAAARHGLLAVTLAVWLRAAGALPPARLRGRRHHRLDPAAVDRVVAGHARSRAA